MPTRASTQSRVAPSLRRQVERQRQRRDDGRRGSSRERGYSARWDRAAKRFRRAHPLCARCEAKGKVVPADVVDHIVPHRGDPALFWDEANWQSLCTSCHSSAKQAEENRGYSTETGADGLPIDPRHPFNTEGRT